MRLAHMPLVPRPITRRLTVSIVRQNRAQPPAENLRRRTLQSHRRRRPDRRGRRRRGLRHSGIGPQKPIRRSLRNDTRLCRCRIPRRRSRTTSRRLQTGQAHTVHRRSLRLCRVYRCNHHLPDDRRSTAIHGPIHHARRARSRNVGRHGPSQTVKTPTAR